MEHDGKTALVTGGSRNIGRAIAVKLAEEGADVGITSRTDEEGCEETAHQVQSAGGTAATATADLGDPDAVKTMVTDIREELGPIDVLINNATYRPEKAFLDLELEDIERTANVNFRGQILTSQHVVPDMLDAGRGSIVNLIGALVYLGDPGHVHSYGTKFSIEGITRQLATELGKDDIRVNAVSPGLIDTNRDRSESFERKKEAIVDSTPLGRLGTPEEIAEVVSFLASERGSFITGQVVHANGGTYPIPTIVPEDRGD
ncbi:3-oxoacyl-[acyl-carrier-protein] reductase [Natronorubrum sediminis]|uniref:3-oxoacyl-[acyl-carrier-protein] reductase n=1 Tax=Natronorubrum sediminis TaxID=640943 RepID=A0A1H6FT40_9EURY|nr:SDR family NAD(P)-dependent oxidoreductase [Natronorubrum sediminis]SEH13572.1 3-oxoacyl-[acyl-carrier-protein] reductase [Natronorubrum sediminis]